jgi:hypothetical protein
LERERESEAKMESEVERRRADERERSPGRCVGLEQELFVLGAIEERQLRLVLCSADR